MNSDRCIQACVWICLWVILAALVQGCSATSESMQIENKLVKINFDPKSGTYNAIDKRDGSEVLSNTVLRLNDWQSSDDGYAHRGTVKKIKDVFGKGKELTVESTAADKPTLVLKLRLYDQHGFISPLATTVEIRESDPVNDPAHRETSQDACGDEPLSCRGQFLLDWPGL